jgi:hypothetical protein
MDTTFTGSSDPMTNWTEGTSATSRIGTVFAAPSTGIFTFPATGKWEIHYFANGSGAAWPTNTGNSYHIKFTTDNSSYSDETRADRWGYGGTYEQTTAASMMLFDVTDTTTHKVSFRAYARTASNITGGSSSQNRTYVVFKKVGDT